MLPFQLLLCLTALILGCNVSGSPSIDSLEVNQYIEHAIEKFKLKIHQAALRHEGRRRRSVTPGVQSNNTDQELLISSIKPVTLLNTTNAIELHPFKIGLNQYIAVVNHGDKTTASEIYQMKNGSFNLVQQFYLPGCVDFEYLDFGAEKYIAFVENNGESWDGKPTNTGLYHAYRYVPPGIHATPFHHEFQVKMHGGTSVKGFLYKDKHYYVAANSRHDQLSRDVKSSLYVKTSYGLRLLEEFATHGAEDVEVFIMDGLIYLAFANHKDSYGMVDIFSTVYRQKQVLYADSRYISFEYVQRILTHGARDFEHFEMKKHHYIVVANEVSQLISYESDPITKSKKQLITSDYEVDSVIYWWSGRFFVEWQRIPTNGAMKWNAFSGPNGEQFLVVANSKSQAVIYVYDYRIGLFKPTKMQGVSPFPNSPHIPDVRSVKAFSSNGETYLAVANYNQSGGHNIFKLNFTYNGLLKPTQTVEEQLRAALNDVTARMAKVKEWYTKMQHSLQAIMAVDGNQTAWGDFTFTNITINNLIIKKGNLIYTNVSKNNPIEKAVQQAGEMKQNLINNSKLIQALEERLNDSVSSSSPSEITGEKIFTGNVTFNGVTVQEMEVGTINGVNLTDLSERAWSKSKAQIITGKNVFMNDVKMEGELQVAGTVNGIRIPEDAMTTNTDQRVRGKKMFAQPVELNGNIVTVNATINGLRIPEDLVLRNANQTILGKKTFTKTVHVKKSIIVNGTTNGQNLSEFSKRVVTISTDQIITGSKVFVNGFGVGGNLEVTGLVDGVNLTDLDLDAARINQNEVIRGKKTIMGSVKIGQNMQTLSTTNGLRLQDDVMTTTTDQIINVSKIFQNDVNVQGDVITNSTINGIDLSEEAVTKSGDQTILGNKTFANDMTINGDIHVTGTVDGVNITELSESVMRKSGENIVTAPKIFTGNVSIGNISISGLINGVNLTQLVNNIWTLDGNHVITAPMTFENLVVDSNLNVSGTINGANLPNDFVTLEMAKKLDKEVTFVDGVVFEGGVDFGVNSTLNGEHFPSFLNEAVLNGTTQNISGSKSFKNELSFQSDIFVDGTINGFRVPSDFVTLNTVQNITGTKTFLNGVTINGTLHTGVINVNTTVNGVDVSELPKDAVYKGDNQTISGTVIFTGNVSVIGPLNVGGLIDGINITELAETAVRLSKPQEIRGQKTFLKDIEFYAPLTSPGLVNKVNLTELDENSLKKKGDQFVSGMKTFAKEIHIGGDVINGTINNINIGDFKRSIVTKNGTETINGDITFLQNVTVNNLNVNGKIDNVSLNDVLMTSGNQNITGRKTIDGDLNLGKNLAVDGLINGVNVSDLNENTMKIYGDQNTTAQLVFQNGFHVNGSININGLVNGVNISDVNRSAVRIDGAEIIRGRKTFLKNMTINGNVMFEETLNGLNMTKLLTDVMSKTKNQTITGKKTFTAENGVKVTSGLTSKNIIAKGLINDVNITALDETAVTLSTDQELDGDYTFVNDTVFDGNVQVKGLLNGVDVSSDVMLTHGDQSVTGPKEFENLVVNGSIQITGKVDGIDVSEFARSRVTLSTNQTIQGQITFADDVTTSGDIELPNGATVNGIDLSEEVLYVDDNPLVINGKKIFTREMIIEGDLSVTGLVQGLNISEIDEKIARIDNVKEMTGRNTFMKNLTIAGNITCHGYINGIKIREIVADTERLANRTQNELSFLNQSTYPVCRKMNVLLNLTGLEKRVDGLEKKYEIAISKGGFIDSVNIDNEVYIAISRPPFSGCGQAYILRCNEKLSCKINQRITTQAIFIQFYKQLDDHFVFVGHYGDNTTGCSYYPEIFKFDKSKRVFASLYNVTSNFYKSHKNLSSSDIVVQNLASLIPSALLSSPLYPTPIDALGTLKSTIPALSRIFVKNGITYLARAHAWTNVYGIEVFTINRKTLAAQRFQQITTREVSAFEIGDVEQKKMLVVAEGRSGSEKVVKLYSFVSERQLFYYYRSVPVAAVSVRFTNIIDNFHFVFATPDVGFGLCPWKGVMGFSQCISVPDNGVQQISQITTYDGVFLVGVKSGKIVIYKTVIRGNLPRYDGNLNCSP